MAIITHKRIPFLVRLVRWFVGAPMVWLMIVPVVIADIFISIYHAVAFPVFGIKKVKRSEYIRLDRHKLSYLTWYEKLGCVYCGYVNGWLHYASVIAGRTENYFCAIAHLEDRGYKQTPQEKTFAKYGDEAALRRRYANHEKDFGRHIT